MFFNFEKYYGLYEAFDFSVTRIKMTNEGKSKCYLLNKATRQLVYRADFATFRPALCFSREIFFSLRSFNF